MTKEGITKFIKALGFTIHIKITREAHNYVCFHFLIKRSEIIEIEEFSCWGKKGNNIRHYDSNIIKGVRDRTFYGLGDNEKVEAYFDEILAYYAMRYFDNK